jgi:shikimate dehydrogenase
MNEVHSYAVIGHPVKHSRSPFIHERFARQFDLSLSYGRIDAAPEAFTGTVHRFFSQGGRGLNVTLPHKQSAFGLVSQLTPRAQRAGAINTLSLLEDGSLAGDNTDGIGLVRDLVDNFGATVAGRRVLLLGAGGAARGALDPLLALQPSTLTIANRSADRAQALAAEFAASGELHGCGFADLQGGAYDLVINATAASLGNEALPLPAGCVDAQSFCYDMVYGAADTPFVHWAQQRGCTRAVMGLGMLVEQAAESFFIWHGLRPDTAAVLAALKVELSLQD